jgi:uncharacterized protein
MKIERTPGPEGNAKIVRRYGDGYIVINEQTIDTSAIVSPDTLDTDWPPESFGELQAQHLQPLLAMEPDVVLLGTGRSQHFPPPELVAPLYRAGIGVEIMDTPAACRTFNILMNEGRKVVAGLLMIQPS